jgi:hypothetical protein
VDAILVWALAFGLLTILLALLLVTVVILWGAQWGSTAEERAAEMPGDAWFEGGRRAPVALTRAVSIRAPPETVWLWLEQLGRGAGWYSHDRLDNGGRISARHIVSWIPEPRIGDASPIGYLRHFVPGREIAWWLGGIRFVGSTARLVASFRVTSGELGSRLVVRMSCDSDSAGPPGWVGLLVFRFIDSIMAVKQLKGILWRSERFGAPREDPERPETGERDQFQLYEVIYASGARAGVPGKEMAAEWRAAAVADGVIEEGPS